MQLTHLRAAAIICGAAFLLSSAAPSAKGQSYTYSVLHIFRLGLYGLTPGPTSGLMEDAQGNLYGTTTGGGPAGCGTIGELSVYKLSVYRLDSSPVGGVILDAQANIYGTTWNTTFGAGIVSPRNVFKLDTNGNFRVLHAFQSIQSPGQKNGGSNANTT